MISTPPATVAFCPAAHDPKPYLTFGARPRFDPRPSYCQNRDCYEPPLDHTEPALANGEGINIK